MFQQGMAAEKWLLIFSEGLAGVTERHRGGPRANFRVKGPEGPTPWCGHISPAVPIISYSFCACHHPAVSVCVCHVKEKEKEKEKERERERANEGGITRSLVSEAHICAWRNQRPG